MQITEICLSRLQSFLLSGLLNWLSSKWNSFYLSNHIDKTDGRKSELNREANKTVPIANFESDLI